MSDVIEAVFAWLASRSDEMQALLQRLVNVDSNGFDKVRK